VALKDGTATAEAILRRFNSYNVTQPTYKALAEVGKAEKTIFLCDYLSSRETQYEVNDGLQVVFHRGGCHDELRSCVRWADDYCRRKFRPDAFPAARRSRRNKACNRRYKDPASASQTGWKWFLIVALIASPSSALRATPPPVKKDSTPEKKVTITQDVQRSLKSDFLGQQKESSGRPRNGKLGYFCPDSGTHAEEIRNRGGGWLRSNSLGPPNSASPQWLR
jgi:Tn3 transposase DDE domain